MWLKSHKWVNHPHTVTERRREMNVRESCHTAMLFDRRYQDIDTGKFDTDKLYTLNNLSLVDLMDEGDSSNWINTYVRQAKRDRQQSDTNVYNFPKYVPKDNGFDEELRREQVAKIAHEKAVKEALDREYALKRLEEHGRILEEKRIELEKNKDAYAKQLAETEERLMKERNERFERMQQANHIRHIGNVRPNVWRQK